MSDRQDQELQYAPANGVYASAEVIAYVALKLLGVYYIMTFVAAVAHVVPILRRFTAEASAATGFAFLSIFWPLVVGLLLFVFARVLARAIVRSRGVVTADLRTDQVVALISVGCAIFLATKAVPSLVANALYLFSDLRTRNAGGDDFSGVTLVQEHLELIYNAVQLLLAILLFVRPDWVVGQFHRRTRMPMPAPAIVGIPQADYTSPTTQASADIDSPSGPA